MSLKGTVKSFSDVKGWGFINLNGEDVFVHIKDCESRPKVGDEVYFDLEDSPAKPGQKKAGNVKGGTAGGSCTGIVKSFSDTKGWGFIDYNGQDIFMHIKHIIGGRPVPGDQVNFDMEESAEKPGQMAAKTVTGGSGEQIGKGKGKGKGKDDGYGGKGGYDNGWGSGGGGGYGGGGGGGGYGPSWDAKGKGGWSDGPYGGGGYGGKGSWDGGKDAWGGGKGSWDGGKGSWDGGKGAYGGGKNAWDSGKGGWDGSKGYGKDTWDAGKSGGKGWNDGKGSWKGDTGGKGKW